MNKFETMKAEKDGLDVWPDLLAHAARRTPVAEIPEDELNRMKWYGVFHRPQKPGTFMIRLRLTGGQMSATQARAIARIAQAHGGFADITSRQNVQLRDMELHHVPGILQALSDAGIHTNPYAGHKVK